MGLLDGVRVLDLGRIIACPFMGMLLADLGAEVIRVEGSAGGSDRRPEDWLRVRDRYSGHLTPAGDSYFFANLNRNKKAISLNFERNERAREMLWKLVKHSTVLIENFSLKAAEFMGITYDNLKAIKPDIILAHVSSFGRTGPYSHRIGLDAVAKALSGSMSITGPPGPPNRDPISYIDYTTGALATVGVLSALYHWQRTGQGQMVDATLLQTAITYMAPNISAWETGGLLRKQSGNRGYWMGPVNLYETKDGKWVYLGIFTNAIWRRFCRFIGREDLATAPEFYDELDRWEYRDIIDPIVSEWAVSQTAEELIAVAEKIPVPCGLCQNIPEVAHDPQVKEQEMLITVPSPDGSDEVLVSNPPLQMSATPLKIERSFPAIGQHNEEIYCGLLGYSKEDLIKLKEAGVI
ncbi:CaiB/BaiF CoA transferase family protein [Chloroflexota bacterium]